MNIDLEAYMDKEQDGYDGSLRMSRQEISDIYQLANLFQEFAVAAGFTYIKAVGFEKDDESIVWSDF
jgi:hypothetical protein